VPFALGLFTPAAVGQAVRIELSCLCTVSLTMRLSVFRTLRERKTLAAICFVVLCVMIVAAFWPFTLRPANHVAWLNDENGLRFNGGGIVLSPNSFEFTDSTSPAGASLELWLEPSQDKYSTALLSFSSAANPDQFRLRQSHDFLLILQQPLPGTRHSGMTWLWVPDVFFARKRRFIAISSGASGTTVYLDGVPAEHPSTFKIDPKGFSGQLILGASPTVYDTWRGKLLGFALFGQELTPSQISQHYRAWLDGRSDVVENSQPVALYTFGERTGNIVHNQITSGPDLTIPGRFQIPYKPFLKAPWNEFYPNFAYLREVFINIAGFIPFGFFFCMFFSSRQPSRKTVISTVVLGTLFSLTIEVLQGYIPMRDSGTTDIFTNTLGTALGALLYRGGTLEVLLRRLEPQTFRKADP
jgi:VanZ like family/Concanavalin A-like lectin/glucanases superfamily